MQFLVDPEILTILRERKDGERFGDTAYRLGLLTRHEIERLANYQRLIQPRIGKYFVERGILTLLEIERLAWESKYLRERTPTTPGSEPATHGKGARRVFLSLLWAPS